MSDQQLGTVVIGGSQAGLAVGYHLRQRRLPFVILDDNDRIGDAWRKRSDSLRLFTLGAGGRCGTGCRAHRRPHRFHAAGQNKEQCVRRIQMPGSDTSCWRRDLPLLLP